MLIAVSCGSPPTVMNATFGVPTPHTTYQGTVIYTCDSGYEISNGVITAETTCLANGDWRPVPHCQRM